MDDKELKMNNRTYWFWFGIAVFLLALSFYLGFDFGYDMRDDTKSVDTIIIEKHDTIHLQQFDTITKKIVNYKQVAVHDTIVRNDTIFAVLPFEQLHYHRDSVCDIWVSGYEPQLDSANIICRERTIIEKYYLQEENRKNTIGLYAGQNSSGCMYIRSINNFQIGALAGYKYDKSGIDVGVVVGYKF